MKPSTILILDDEPAFGKFLQEFLTEMLLMESSSVEMYSDEFTFKERLSRSTAPETLILVNLCFRPQIDALRYKLSGLNRIVKLGLRVIWQARHPVIVYGPLMRNEVFSSTYGAIFVSSRSHAYYDFFTLRETLTPSQITKMSHIYTEDELRYVINHHCKEQLLQELEGAKHLLGKSYKVDCAKERVKLIQCLQSLRGALLQEDFMVLCADEMIERLQSFSQSADRGPVIKDLCHIVDGLDKLITKIQLRGDSHVSLQGTFN